MTVRKPFTWLLLVGLILGPRVVSLSAADSQVERASLAGLTTISVVVEDLPAIARANGLTTQAVQTEVERRLRQAGITLTPDADAYLYVLVTVADPGPSLPIPFFVNVAFMQEVTLPRNIQTRTPLQCETWSLKRLGLVSSSGLRAAVSDRVNEFVDQFVEAFRSVNPKR